jgi:hypothetical protein
MGGRHHRNTQLQHITQVNVLLVAVKVVKDEPRRIGFVLQQKLNNTDGE